MSIDFSVSEITDANLTGADLREALAHPLDTPWVFTRCDLSDADLKDTDLTGAVFTD
ncbi:MAG TPA: pentapeptide repeat-containing protein [Candidatus Nocardiopsis merdipullorum]|nr:pentapeptide repeat-containing protein [Candidatus Nocardiopsis merdipullorum]